MTLEKTKEAFCPRFLLGFLAPFSSRNYLWLPSNCKEFWGSEVVKWGGGGGGGYLQRNSIPSRGNSNTLSRIML